MPGLSLALWLFSLAPDAGVVQPPTAEPVTLAQFSGEYRYVGGQAQHDRLRRAIDVAIEPMLDLIEGFARRKLNANLSPAAYYDFSIEGSDVRIDDRTGHAMAGVANGARFQWKGDDGKQRASTIRYKRGVIVVRVVGPHSSTRIVYRLAASGKRLTRTTTIVDDRMPLPLTYKFTYRRLAQ